MTKRAAHYTARVADEICICIIHGKTLEQALKDVGYFAPTLNTVYKWLELHADFREKYDRARQLQADIHADKMLEMAQDVLTKPTAAAAYRVAVDILKWQSEVRNRGKYGPKSDDAGKNKPLDPTKLKAEIKRLEKELGVVESKVVSMKVVK